MKNLTKIISFVLVLTCTLAAVCMPTIGNADGPTKSTTQFVEWTRVRSYSDLPTDTDHTYYMYLVWHSDNGNPNDLSSDSSDAKIMTPHRYISSYDSNGNPNYDSEMVGEIYSESALSKVFSMTEDSFTTSSPYGMPQIVYRGKDGGNNNCPQYSIKLNAGKGDYIKSDRNNFCYSSSSYTSWGIAVHEVGSKNKKYEASAEHDGCVCIYHNYSGGTDSGFLFHGVKLTCEKDVDYDDFDPFMMWVGKEVTYSIITENYNVMPGEVLSIKDRVIIKNGVAVTIYPGGVLSVDGTLINNGGIKNMGTLIVEEGGEILPIAMGTDLITDKNAIDSDSNTIVNYGSGHTVSVPGYKKKLRSEGIIINKGNITFATNMGCLYCYSKGQIENYGFILMSSRIYMMDCDFNNYGIFIAGYTLKNPAFVWGYDSTGRPNYYTYEFTLPAIGTYKYVLGPCWGIPGLTANKSFNTTAIEACNLTNTGKVFYCDKEQTW